MINRQSKIDHVSAVLWIQQMLLSGLLATFSSYIILLLKQIPIEDNNNMYKNSIKWYTCNVLF